MSHYSCHRPSTLVLTSLTSPTYFEEREGGWEAF